MPRVLLVEHDAAVAELARRYLAREGFTVRIAGTAGDAAAALADLGAGRYQPDVVVLDLTMPGLGGREIRRGLCQPGGRRGGARRPPGPGRPGPAASRGRPGSSGRPGRLRAAYPLVCLAGPGGLRPQEAGVPESACLSRPFGPRELVVRVRAAAAAAAGSDSAGAAGCSRRASSVNGGPSSGAGAPSGENPAMQRFEDVPLTATERDLLTFLLASPGRVFTRERLLAALARTADGHLTGPASVHPDGHHAGPGRGRARTATGGPGEHGGGSRGRRGPAGPRAVDVYVAQLRAKLGDRSPIRTVRGIGYSAQPHGADERHAWSDT